MPKYSKLMVKRICDLIEEDDYIVKDLCKNAGISEATYYEWLKTKPEFSEAVKDAQFKRLDKFKVAARSGLLTLLAGKTYTETTTEYTSDSKGKPKIKSKKHVEKVVLPNASAVIFALKTVDNENFKELLRISNPDGTPVDNTSAPIQFYIPDNGRGIPKVK